MKNIYKLLTLALTLTIITSCERDQGEYPYLDRDITIGFRGASASLFVENGASNVVSASIGASTIVSSDATFSVSVDDSSTAVLGVDFDFASGQDGTLMSGNLITTIDIIADFDNSVVEGKSVVLNLTSNDPSLLVSEAFSQYTITLFQYCPFDGLNTTSYTAYPSAFGADAPDYPVVLTPVGSSTTEYTIASGWGPNFVSWATGDPAYDGQFQYSGTITINEDFTINFVGNDAWATGGSGEFSPCTQEFSYTLSQGLFTTAFDTSVVLIPN